MKKFRENLINKNLNFDEILKKINTAKRRILIVQDKRKILGTITDSDIRKHMLDRNYKLTAENVMNSKPRILQVRNQQKFELKKLPKNIRYFPVVDDRENFKFVYENKSRNNNFFKNIVIMAGGKGLRLRPLTKKIPKPMIRIKGKPLLDLQLKILSEYDTDNIFISVNYLKEKIINYFKKKKYNLKYIIENKPLGTAGSLSRIKLTKENFPLLIMNGDILTNFNFNEFYNFHCKFKNDITIGSSRYNTIVPFGVMNYDKNYNLKKIDEKPTFQYLCSAGIYAISYKVIRLIPKNKKFDFSELINTSIKKKLKIKIFPIYETWNDIGDKEILNQIRKIKSNY